MLTNIDRAFRKHENIANASFKNCSNLAFLWNYEPSQ